MNIAPTRRAPSVMTACFALISPKGSQHHRTKITRYGSAAVSKSSPTLASLYEGAVAEGYAIEDVSVEMATAMASEASTPVGPSVAELFGLVT